MVLAVLPCFCPFVGVACVARLLSAVAGLIVHFLSFPFEGKDGVVRGSLILADLLAPPWGARVAALSTFVLGQRAGGRRV